MENGLKMGKYTELVNIKLTNELKEIEGKCGNQHRQMCSIGPSVVKTLKAFSEDDDFASRLMDEDKTLLGCLEFILEDVQAMSSISDLLCYQRAAQYYFETAKVTGVMYLEYDEKPAAKVNHDGTQEKPITPKPVKTNAKKETGKSKVTDTSAKPPEQKEPVKKCIQLDLFAALTGGK